MHNVLVIKNAYDTSWCKIHSCLCLCLMSFPMFSKSFLTMLKVFMEKVYCAYALNAFKRFCDVENSFPVFTKLNKINTRKKANNILNFNFTTLCKTIPYNLLIKV